MIPWGCCHCTAECAWKQVGLLQMEPPLLTYLSLPWDSSSLWKLLISMSCCPGSQRMLSWLRVTHDVANTGWWARHQSVRYQTDKQWQLCSVMQKVRTFHRDASRPVASQVLNTKHTIVINGGEAAWSRSLPAHINYRLALHFWHFVSMFSAIYELTLTTESGNLPKWQLKNLKQTADSG